MECEKFEPLLIDELYDELDELTSAAVKRHVSGCSRCASILNDMRGTRQLVSLPLHDPPSDLAERIIAAARAAKVTSLRSQCMRALSWAGTWAMRPQTAMAAVFLFMVGFSAILLRANQRPSAHSAEVSVTVVGEPAQSMATTTANHEPQGDLADKVAAAAHGPSAPAPVAASASGLADSPFGSGGGERAGSAGGRTARARASAPPRALEMAESSPLAPADMESKRAQALDPFSSAMAAYRAGNFAQATRQFDLIAADARDLNAAIWAARSVRDGRGCGAALGRYDAVAQKAAGSPIGNDALFESANCQIKLGQVDAARGKLNQLLGAAEYEARARQALSDLNVVAARKAPPSRESAPSAVGASEAAAPPPAAARPAAPAAAPASKGTR